MRSISIHELANHVGQELGVSDWFLIDQERIDTFAQATGDRQWIHVDVERATRERGGTIAHGFLILSLIPVLHESVTEITDISFGLNYGLNRVRFIGPVAAGTRVRLREKLLSVEVKQNGTVVTYEFVIEREGEDKPALIAESLGLVIL